jgi:hypothetical protein
MRAARTGLRHPNRHPGDLSKSQHPPFPAAELTRRLLQGGAATAATAFVGTLKALRARNAQATVGGNTVMVDTAARVRGAAPGWPASCGSGFCAAQTYRMC